MGIYLERVYYKKVFTPPLCRNAFIPQNFICVRLIFRLFHPASINAIGMQNYLQAYLV